MGVATGAWRSGLMGARAPARDLHQRLVGAAPFRAFDLSLRLQVRIRPVVAQDPRLPPVAQADIQYLPQLFPRALRQDGRDDLDAPGEIAVHPVRGPDEELSVHGMVVAVGEVKDPRVLEESSDDRPDANPLGPAGNAGPEAAEAAHDEIDGHARTGGLDQRLDDVRIFELVHLAHDPGRAARLAMLGFALNEIDQALPQSRGR